MERITELDAAIQKICPIDGVARLKDGKFRIDFKREATAKQRADAQAVAAAFDWSAPEPIPEPPLTQDEIKQIRALLAARK